MSPAKCSPHGFIHLRLLLVSLLLLFLLAAAVWRAGHAMKSMSVIAGNSRTLEQPPPDGSVKIVVEISDTDARGGMHGTLLEKRTEQLYLRTKTSVTVRSTPETKLVMGKREDVREGAVVHVTGRLTGDGRIDAQQIVILTGYVKVN